MAFFRSVQHGRDHQVDVVVAEPGQGVAQIHRDSGGDAGREAQDPLFACGTGQVAGVECGEVADQLILARPVTRR